MTARTAGAVTMMARTIVLVALLTVAVVAGGLPLGQWLGARSCEPFVCAEHAR